MKGLRAEAPLGVDRGLMGGYVGYLGYELKADCGATNVHSSDLPDAALMLANRVVAVDHARQRTHLFALVRDDATPAVDGPKTGLSGGFSAHQQEERGAATAWLEAATRLAAAAICDPPSERPLDPPAEPGAHVSFRVGRGRAQYLADIERSQAELAAGESYEVCLTDQISTDASPDPFALYRRLRRSNPSPFAAFLRFGDTAIVSSSPERFLSVGRDGAVQARPIKGTISRAEDPAEDAARRAELAGDEKTRAEHLMIVDLLRNDLGRVSEVDSVRVPDLMVVEPYATVHQVVSTVTGQLEAGRSPVECVRNCFPGGSMTGAPKERTMEIIDELEDEARGVYSGAIGYFGVDGAVDLSIVIRTIVIRPGRTTIGAGGAIVMQSDPVEEFDEILLKARAPMVAIARTVTGRADEGAWSVEARAGRGPGGERRGRMREAVAQSPAAEPGEVGWELRPARPEDAEAVSAAVVELLIELGATPSPRPAIEAEASAHIADPSLGLVLVATAGDDLVGVLAASWARAIQVPGRMLTIEVLWTRSDWRGEGVGAGLVEELAAAATREGVGRVEVGLPREGFAALRATERFYLANGFERLGPRMRKALG